MEQLDQIPADKGQRVRLPRSQKRYQTSTGLETGHRAGRLLVGKMENDPQLTDHHFFYRNSDIGAEAVVSKRDQLQRQATEQIMSFIENLNTELDLAAIQERLSKTTLWIGPSLKGKAGEYLSEQILAESSG